MNANKSLIRIALILSIACCSILPFLWAADGDLNASVPSIVKVGLAVYASGGPDPALGAWRKGGPSEIDPRAGAQAEDFKQVEKSFGNYKSYELIETREVCRTSKTVYLSMNFERGAVYASFLVFKTSKDWVVQHLEFNTKPDVIMPWLTSNPNE